VSISAIKLEYEMRLLILEILRFPPRPCFRYIFFLLCRSFAYIYLGLPTHSSRDKTRHSLTRLPTSGITPRHQTQFKIALHPLFSTRMIDSSTAHNPPSLVSPSPPPYNVIATILYSISPVGTHKVRARWSINSTNLEQSKDGRFVRHYGEDRWHPVNGEEDVFINSNSRKGLEFIFDVVRIPYPSFSSEPLWLFVG
jgi:hypothetical protein